MTDLERPASDDAALLRAIAATPRPVGGPAIRDARARCADALRELGFEVRERPFEFSALSGRYATPLIGGGAAFMVGVAGHFGARGQATYALAVLVLGSLALLVSARWFARRGVLSAPVLRARGVNLEATRPSSRATVWLCAHLDTKSQPIPTLVRSMGIVLEANGVLMTTALAIMGVAGAQADAFFWGFAAVVTLSGALPVVSSVVGSRSPGALDDASGVATVIAAARQLADLPHVGVLLTDAEELGLAGARAWVRENTVGIVLNCDGVDDHGRIEVMYTGSKPAALLSAVMRASAGTRIPIGVSRLIPGLLTDSVAFTDAGLASLTFSRGSWRSLARVHSSRDDLSRLNGTGISETADLISRTVREIH